MAVEADHRVEGDVEPGFGRVADAFRLNSKKRGEVGAAVAVFKEGMKIVDLWGGFRDGTRQLPWEEDTMVLVFFSTKGLAATAVHVAHARGLFEYDDRVADHWPELAQAGGILLVGPSHGDAAMASIEHRYRLAGVLVARSGSYKVWTSQLDTYLVAEEAARGHSRLPPRARTRDRMHQVTVRLPLPEDPIASPPRHRHKCVVHGWDLVLFLFVCRFVTMRGWATVGGQLCAVS